MNVENLYLKVQQAYKYHIIRNLCKAEIEYLSEHYMEGKKPSCNHCAASLVNYASKAYLNWEKERTETPAPKSKPKKAKKK